MAGAQVLGGKKGLYVKGHGPIHQGHYDEELVAAAAVIGPAAIASLIRALRRWAAGRRSVFATVCFIEAPAAKVAGNPDKWMREPVELQYWSSEVRGEEEFSIFAASYGDPDDGLPNEKQVEQLIGPFLRTYRASGTVGVDDDESDYGGMYRLGIDITFPTRGKTVDDAYQLGKGVLALYEAVEAGSGVNRETALGVLRGGRPDVLIGQHETDWIDFKREPYKKDDHGKLELAKDVAAFANADGGLLVLGVATTKSSHTEAASKILPIAAGGVSPQSYRAVVARRVHPPPVGFDVFSVPQPGGEVWVVSVPPQPDELKPFLVHGAVVDAKVNDSYFSIVSRRADEAVPTDPEAVHALLAAGRAALRVPARSRQQSGRR